ncbi:MAG: DNA repair protein RecO [Legionellales bacterium]|nr:DNA repair protein RecO [Legionellales bacterium]
MRVQLAEALVLHTRPFRDTSLLVTFFTRDHGKIETMAKNARGMKSRFRGQLQPFQPLLISFSGKTELMTLTHLELIGQVIILSEERLFSALYLNELLVKLLQPQDSHPELFTVYAKTLQELTETDSIEVTLRYFEKKLLRFLGYELNLDFDAHTHEKVDAKAYYLLDVENGPVKINTLHPNHPQLIRGEYLLALQQETLVTKEHLKAAKWIMRQAFNRLLNGKTLKSRDLFVPFNNEE